MVKIKLLPRVVSIVASAALLFAAFGTALASETESPQADADQEAPVADRPSVSIDHSTGVITIGLPLDGAAPDCAPEEAEPAPDEESTDAVEQVEVAPEGSATDDEALSEDREAVVYGPGDCLEFTVDHPSGKTHHGAVVSTVARNLHPSMIDGLSKGQIMRWVAKLKQAESSDMDELDVETDDGAGGPPDHAKDKAAKDKANKDKANNGKGKAKGKNK